MGAWGVITKGGIFTEAESEQQAREWAGYDYKAAIGHVGETLALRNHDGTVTRVHA